MPEVNLIPLRQIDRRMRRLDDRPLMLALRQEGFDWLVTANYRMLRNPLELAGILKARLKVFAIEGVGDDPIRATGALLLDLPGAIRKGVPGRAQVFWSRPRAPESRDPWDLFADAAERRHQDPQDLYEEMKVTDEEAATPWPEMLPDD